MSLKSNISLINLSKQFPFDIDEVLKKQICFGETLVVSCGHVDGCFVDSECSTSDSSSDSGVVQETENIKPFEIIDQTEEDVQVETIEDDNNFQFFFFPDCTKPIEAVNSKSSLIIKDGLPQINPAKSLKAPQCTCEIDKHGRCECFRTIPCKCGAKQTLECECSNLKEICVCNDGILELTCVCKETDVCTCQPDGLPRPNCTCNRVDKPCICHPDKFPYPVCICEHKPKSRSKKGNNDEVDEEYAVEESSSSSSKLPCDCQEPEPNLECVCEEEMMCPTCNQDPCECYVQNICVCDPVNDTNDQGVGDHEENCTCPKSEECSCQPNIDATCKCFPIKNQCTCGNPENCKCFHICECTEPCICDTERKNEIECTCLDADEGNRGEGKKIKKVRAGKHGYRWCHDVDPRHTYFGYGYGRHDKILYSEVEEKKTIISDAKRDKDPGDVIREEKSDVPIYNKKLGKLSLDCCSAVGGVTINVETLGEDKGKFLVQVVSHSSKEGAKTGSKFVSIVDCRLHTLEENRTEYIHKGDKFKEKRNYMAICESGYYNKVTRICGDRHLIKRFYHTFEEAHNFLLEGANIVLMRYVGLTRYKGCIKTDTVLIDGVICENIYVCLGVSHAVVNGRQFFVEKVERHIIEPSGNIHQTLLVLTLKGYVVSQEWAHNSYFIHINPLLRVIPERDEIEPHEPLRETWREDLQLLSDYLDFKAKRSSEGARYVSENGELTGTIRDYLQALLLLRPSDALHFTRHYFGAALSALDLPHNEFFDSSTKHVRYYFFED